MKWGVLLYFYPLERSREQFQCFDYALPESTFYAIVGLRMLSEIIQAFIVS